jgi:hypothetical protein
LIGNQDVFSDRPRPKIADRLSSVSLEGIVRESARPLEKIDGVKIFHVDGMVKSVRLR